MYISPKSNQTLCHILQIFINTDNSMGAQQISTQNIFYLLNCSQTCVCVDLSCFLLTLLIPLWVVVVRIIAKSTSDAKDAKWVYALVYTCTNGGRTCTCATQQLCTYMCTCTNVTTSANTVTNN